MYLDKIQICASSIEAFYFRLARDGSFAYEKMAVGINTLSKILPDKLCKKAGIKKKTAHRLRITCATRVSRNGVNEKQTRERTDHTQIISRKLYGYLAARHFLLCYNI